MWAALPITVLLISRVCYFRFCDVFLASVGSRIYSPPCHLTTECIYRYVEDTFVIALNSDVKYECSAMSSNSYYLGCPRKLCLYVGWGGEVVYYFHVVGRYVLVSASYHAN